MVGMAGRAADTDEDGTQNGTAAAGSAGDQTQALEQTDHQCRLVADIMDIFHSF